MFAESSCYDGCKHVPTAAFGCGRLRDGGRPVADEPVAIPGLEGTIAGDEVGQLVTA